MKLSKTTKELEEQLEHTSPAEIGRFLSGDYIGGYADLADMLNQFLHKKGLRPPDVFERALINPNYGYQIMSGGKTTISRDRVLALCIAMGMELDDVQRALKLARCGALYARDRRDAVLIVCINSHMTRVMQVNEELGKNGLNQLVTSRDT